MPIRGSQWSYEKKMIESKNRSWYLTLIFYLNLRFPISNLRPFTVKSLFVAAATIKIGKFLAQYLLSKIYVLLRLLFKGGYYLRAATNKDFTVDNKNQLPHHEWLLWKRVLISCAFDSSVKCRWFRGTTEAFRLCDYELEYLQAWKWTNQMIIIVAPTDHLYKEW